MKLLYIASILAVPALAKAVQGNKERGITCPPCPTGHCCITTSHGPGCGRLGGLGEACTDSTEAPFPGVCPCAGDMVCAGGVCVQT